MESSYIGATINKRTAGMGGKRTLGFAPASPKLGHIRNARAFEDLIGAEVAECVSYSF